MGRFGGVTEFVRFQLYGNSTSRHAIKPRSFAFSCIVVNYLINISQVLGLEFSYPMLAADFLETNLIDGLEKLKPYHDISPDAYLDPVSQEEFNRSLNLSSPANS